MSEMMMPHIHQEGMKSFITQGFEVSGESRAGLLSRPQITSEMEEGSQAWVLQAVTEWGPG